MSAEHYQELGEKNDGKGGPDMPNLLKSERKKFSVVMLGIHDSGDRFM